MHPGLFAAQLPLLQFLPETASYTDGNLPQHQPFRHNQDALYTLAMKVLAFDFSRMDHS